MSSFIIVITCVKNACLTNKSGYLPSAFLVTILSFYFYKNLVGPSNRILCPSTVVLSDSVIVLWLSWEKKPCMEVQNFGLVTDENENVKKKEKHQNFLFVPLRKTTKVLSPSFPFILFYLLHPFYSRSLLLLTPSSCWWPFHSTVLSSVNVPCGFRMRNQKLGILYHYISSIHDHPNMLSRRDITAKQKAPRLVKTGWIWNSCQSPLPRTQV